MIAVIVKDSKVNRFIAYNESKVKTGKALEIFNNTLAKTTTDKELCFNETAELNSRVHKNKFFHIQISLPPGESLNDEKFVEVSADYLSQMGFNETPTLIYRHNDKKHEHLHIIASAVNFDGEYNTQLNGFYKRESQKITRGLEYKYGLAITEYKDRDKKNIKETNSNKYGLISALSKAALHQEHAPAIFSIPGTQEIIALYKVEKDLPNEKIGALYSEKGLSKEFGELQSYLKKNNLLYRTNKEELLARMDFLYLTSPDKKSFFKKLENNKIYVRELKTGIKYGIPDSSFYIHERKMPKKYQSAYLDSFSMNKEKDVKGKVNATQQEQRSFIYRTLSKALKKSTSIEMLRDNLALNQVQLNTVAHPGNGKIYGLKLKALAAAEPLDFKASEIHRSLSYENVIAILNENEKKTKEYKPGSKIELFDSKTDSSSPVKSVNTRKLQNELDKDSDAERARLKRDLGLD